MRRGRLPALLLAAGLVLAGCASSPEPAFYTLAPVSGAPIPTSGRPGGKSVVELRRIGLAGYLDRSEIVRANDGVRLRISGRDRWAEPLDDMIGRILSEDLAQRLPGLTILSEAGAISASGDVVVELEIQRLDADQSGNVVLAAQVSVRSTARAAGRLTRAMRLSARPADDSTGALVEAMSTALGQLADAVAEMIATRPSPMAGG